MKRNYIFNLIASVVLFIAILCGQVFLSAFSLPTFAEETATEHSDVLDDLSRDATFDASAFPELDTLPDMPYDLLDVIQVAEGKSGVLYVYVYAPYETAPAEYITMSRTQSADYRRYNLKLCNVNGALEKYVIEGFKIANYPKRYYNINSIHCYYEGGFNGEDDIFLVDSVTSSVNECWLVTGSGANVKYQTKEVLDSIYIPASDMVCGHIEYALDAPWDILINSGYNQKSCNSNFIAFRVDIDIDKIKSAGVIYNKIKRTQETNNVTGQTEESTTTTKNIAVELSEENNVVVEDLSHYYSWKRIQSVEEFVQTEELLPEAREAVSDYQWVLRFTETEYTQNQNLISYSVISEYVEEVQIFKLDYYRNGKVYSVGVVSDLASPDDLPENDLDKTEKKGIANKTSRTLRVFFAVIFGGTIILIIFSLMGSAINSIAKKQKKNHIKNFDRKKKPAEKRKKK